MDWCSLRPTQRGFSLYEILIVCLILGIIAAIVGPRFSDATSGARVGATVEDLRAFKQAIIAYAMNSQGRMPLSNSELQTGIEEFLPPGATYQVPAIGGTYGFHSFVATDSAAVGIWGAEYPELRLAIDEKIDDGNLSTGRAREGPNDGLIYFVYGPVPTSFP